MKRMILHTFILVATTLATLLVITNCNPVTGDNKESKIDSAPKPELTSLSIRKDVPPVFTNTFNGKIQLIEKNLFDTVTYNIYVYKNKVRIDKVQPTNNESYIFDLISNEKIIQNHPNKLYSIEPYNEEKTTYDSTFKIIKTENEKSILGMKCKQWRVKNTRENTEVTYWVSTNNYGFYYYLTKIWNSKIKVNKYFQVVSNSFGFMPLEVTERNLLRDVKSSLIVSQISQEIPDSSLFIIPTSYAQFSN
ncbi:MAG TPA: DUF4412 domain-containing protein [Bacteroidales bacterium]|nr:DUF4412 domain-containing protein [Bacteroidales bacterium]